MIAWSVVAVALGALAPKVEHALSGAGWEATGSESVNARELVDGMWSDFNEANRSAMLNSEVISWPVTMIILVLAFGSLVAAGLPLMLTILGLVASAGSLDVGTQLLDISIWAMNFALMFALALGVDYALFLVMRFRAAFFGSELSAEEAVAETMDTAGKAVLFSGLTVLISLTAVMLVPSPAFRSMALGIMLAVIFILAATLTLSGPLPPKEMGVILGIAVLLDAALVRLLLVPVLLRLMGRWAWWLPRPLDRILPDVRFGHA